MPPFSGGFFLDYLDIFRKKIKNVVLLNSYEPTKSPFSLSSHPSRKRLTFGASLRRRTCQNRPDRKLSYQPLPVRQAYDQRPVRLGPCDGQPSRFPDHRGHFPRNLPAWWLAYRKRNYLKNNPRALKNCQNLFPKLFIPRARHKS